MYFQYGPEEIDYLKKKDKKLGKAIDDIGIITRRVNPDIFASLIESVVGQQISSKAAQTVNARLLDLTNEITPERLMYLNLEQIQKCGMSLKKASYIRGIAEAAFSGKVKFNELYRLSDEEIIRELISLKGVGEWTAEMLLIFSLQRKNVVSYKDLAIRRGMMNLYGIKELTKEKFQVYKKRYSPYGTVASLYLWELSHENS